MPTTIKAHAFWVTPVDGDPAQLRQLAIAFGNNDEETEFTQGQHSFLAAEAAWHQQAGCLTATIFRRRDSNLPAALNEDGDVGELPIDEDTDLGEPMCFAYFPDLGAAFVHYNHTGPRHPTIAAFLNQIGFAHAIQIEPVIRQDMLERLDDTTFASSVEFGLSDPHSIQDLRAADSSVGQALDLVRDLNGVNVSIRVTVGRRRTGGGLTVNKVKDLARGLAQFGDTEVSSLKVRGSNAPDAAMETLDLLHARLGTEIEIADRGREMDRDDCRRKLVQVFNQGTRAMIEQQLGNGQ